MDRPDALLFDFDGTIVDSRAPYVHSLNHALAAVGLPTHAPQELHQYLGPPMHETLMALSVPPELEEPVSALYRERYAAHGLEETVVYDGVRELLEHLSGQLPLAVATSKVRTLAEPLLEHLGLWELFDVVCAASPEVVSEPKSATVAAALAALGGRVDGGRPAGHDATTGSAPRITAPIMIGDRRFDVEGAAVHGIPTIGVLWGAGSEQELRAAGAVALVREPAEIAALLGL